MDYSQFIFALAVIIIGVVRWFIENRNNAGNGERRDTDPDLPDWQWPTEEKKQAPPPLPTKPPPAQRSPAPTQAPRQIIPTPVQLPSGLGSLSALQHKIAEAKKRAQQAEAQRIKFSSKSPPKKVTPATHTHTPQGMDWLLNPKSLRRAIIAREILGPPLALRDNPDSEIR